jgi:hypothetical protein
MNDIPVFILLCAFCILNILTLLAIIFDKPHLKQFRVVEIGYAILLAIFCLAIIYSSVIQHPNTIIFVSK